MKDGGPAFPVVGMSNIDGHAVMTVFDRGQSLRDWFAGMALQGMAANPSLEIKDRSMSGPQALSVASYDIADAMLAERKK